MGKWLLWGVAGMAGIVVALILGWGWYLDYAMTHRGSTDIDEHAAENARAYAHAPILWVGESYNIDTDTELEPFSTFGVRGGLEGVPDEPIDIYIGYGQCDFPDYEGGCALPLSMTFKDPCEFIGDPPRIDDIRGVEAHDAGDHLYLLTRDYTIAIWGARRDEVARSLVGANALASDIGLGDDLPRRPGNLCR
jgi:hypothetical protein